MKTIFSTLIKTATIIIILLASDFSFGADNQEDEVKEEVKEETTYKASPRKIFDASKDEEVHIDPLPFRNRKMLA